MTTDSYTLKEMVSKVLEQNEKALVTQARMLAHAENVDNHLLALNSKVAANVEKIGKLQTEHTQAKAYAVAVSAIFGVVITGVNLFFK